MLGGKRASAIPERFADGIDAAFALNCFEQDGADSVVKFGFEVGDIVEADEFTPGDDGSKGQAIFFGGGDADGAEGAAVKGILQARGCGVLLRAARTICGGAGAEAREFQGAINGFRAAVGEEDAV